jgi:hypothetical protein
VREGCTRRPDCVLSLHICLRDCLPGCCLPGWLLAC